MPKDEIYPTPSVALALIEIKHPPVEQLSSPELSVMRTTLANTFPVQRNEESIELNIPTGEQRKNKFVRFIARDLFTTASFKDDAVVLETTDYRGWDTFKENLTRTIAARADVTPLAGVERIGLRYINEVRVPDATPDWKEWVRDSLVGPVPRDEGLNLTLKQRQGTSVFETDHANESVILNFTTGEGQAVISTPNLVRPADRTGPFFLLDIDSIWVPDRTGIPEFDTNSILDICERLHARVINLFEFCIQDRLRNEVLRVDY